MKSINSIKSRIIYFKRQEPDVLFADKRTYVAANGAKISFSNDSKVKHIWIMYLKLLEDHGKAETLVFR